MVVEFLKPCVCSLCRGFFFSIFEISSPAKASKNIELSPVKDSPLRKNLRHDVPAPVSPTTLYNDVELKLDYDPYPLPGHMTLLESHFKDFDSALAFAYNRARCPVSFPNVRQVLKRMSGWDVSHTRVAQFKAVFPDAVELEKRGETAEHLHLRPVVLDGEVTPGDLATRCEIFHENLIEIVKVHHDVSALEIGTPRNQLGLWIRKMIKDDMNLLSYREISITLEWLDRY
jgi:hypothetical protein